MLVPHRSPRPALLTCLVLLALAGGCDDGAEVCQPADASNRVGLEVDIGDYPVVDASADGYRLDDVACAVAAVDLSDPARVRTELDCEAAGGTNHAVVVAHASSDLGAPAWAAGDALRLSIELRVYSDLNDIPLYAVTLRSPEGEAQLLVLDNDDLRPATTGPIELSLDPDECGPDGIDEQTRGVLSLTIDGVTTMVADGNDGTLQTPAGTWAVELERALSGDFGERSLYMELLVMKVQ